MYRELNEMIIPRVFTRRLLMSYLIATCFEAHTDGLEILTTGRVYTNSRCQLDESNSSRSENVMRHFLWGGKNLDSGAGMESLEIDTLMVKYLDCLGISSGRMSSLTSDGFEEVVLTGANRIDTDQTGFNQMAGGMKVDLARSEQTEQWNYSIDAIPNPATSVVMVIGASISACTVLRRGFQNLTKH